MNIIEAMKSGKRFRRKEGDGWFFAVTDFIPTAGPSIGRVVIERHDLLADDWEVEEKKVEITKDTLANAYVASHGNTYDIKMIDRMAKNLGLE